MTESPRISVLMTAYNAAKYIADALDSVLAQSFGDFELIVVDNGSTDNTQDILSRYRDKRIVKIKNRKNLTVTESRNVGGTYTRGEFLAVHDADDLSDPDRFLKQVAFLDKHDEVGVLGTQGWLDHSSSGNTVCTIAR